jgi:vacuolar-type H+-ATPase subunit I/STV1
MGSNQEEFRKAIHDKKVPLLVLDQKWHRLFAIHGKPDRVTELETEINTLLAKQGKLNSELKSLKKLKAQLMESIVQNMDGTSEEAEHTSKERMLDEVRTEIDETNEKMEACEDELLEIPNTIKSVNEELMIESMEYFYEKLRQNRQEANEIDEWITQVRIDLKKNILRKQNREINNREMYAYLHDIFGPEVLDLFDIEYSQKPAEEEKQEES